MRCPVLAGVKHGHVIKQRRPLRFPSDKTNGGGKYLPNTSQQSPQSLRSLRAVSSSIRRLILRDHRTAALTNSVGGLRRDPSGGRIGVRSGRTGKMTIGWGRSLGNVRSFVSNSTGGLRGRTNIASWIVAGTLAYFLWVKPAQDLKREHEERAALAAADPYRREAKNDARSSGNRFDIWRKKQN